MDIDAQETVAILGGNGVMGQSIALALAQRGIQVRLWGRSPERLTQAIENMWSGPFGWETAITKKKVSYSTAVTQRSLVTWSTDLAEIVEGVDLVIESVSESPALKREIFARVEPLIANETIIASNTSSIMVAEMAGALHNAARLLAVHWFYPANIMGLVEVVPSRITNPDVLGFVIERLKRWGKKPQVVKDSPGFFMTRFINAFVREAWQLVDEGIATAEQVDLMLKEGLGWPMGVFELQDRTGSFEAWYRVQAYLGETLGGRYNIPALARACYMAGYRGDPTIKPESRGNDRDFLRRDSAVDPIRPRTEETSGDGQ
jgi:3-hydroxybutyryl-CoA dehydrogenase